MIETERLLLQPHVEDNFDAYRTMIQDPQIMQYIRPEPSSDDDAWLRFLANAGRWRLHGYGLFAVTEKSSNSFIGEMGFGEFRRGLGRQFDPFHEAAWIFSGKGQNKGYAYEAGLAIHDWLYEKHEPDKTVCIISPENLPSIRLATKLGYKPFDEQKYKGSPVTLFERQPD